MLYELIVPDVDMIGHYALFWGDKSTDSRVQLFKGHDKVDIWNYIDRDKFANYEQNDNDINELFDKDEISEFLNRINITYGTRAENVDKIVISKDELTKIEFDKFMNICKSVTGSYTYSFATKVFSFVHPDDCPIMDSRSVTLIWYYLNQENKKKNPKSKWGIYGNYIKAYDDFITQLKLSGVKYKEIDEFLWTYATAIRNYYIKELGLLEYLNIEYMSIEKRTNM